MILGIMGTESFPFDRLVRELDRMAAERVFGDEPFFVQLGSSTYEPQACAWDRLIPFGEMYSRVQEARIVVSHAGAGTLLLCNQLGARQIVVPRRGDRGEHLDDHQLELAERMDELGLVQMVRETDDLQPQMQAVLSETGARTDVPQAAELVGALSRLAQRWRAD